jgi:hypothetical protein
MARVARSVAAPAHGDLQRCQIFFSRVSIWALAVRLTDGAVRILVKGGDHQDNELHPVAIAARAFGPSCVG